MAEKPRVKAPKKRDTPKSNDAGRRRLLLVVGGIVAALAVAGGAFYLLRGDGSQSEESVRASLEDAGCTLQAVKALPGRHSLGENEIGDWNTDPPTSGPHFGFDQNTTQGTVIWGAYSEPLQLARVVHNLEHGGVYVFYGDDVPDDVVEQLRAFYDDHPGGTLLAPYPKLGKKIALGAWVADDTGKATGYLAKCPAFDDGAFSAFLSAFQFQGPERFPAESLLPGGS